MDNHVFVATGYSGNGMTFGTAAGMLLRDLVLGYDNPWRELFDPTRVKPIAAAKDFIETNAAVGLHFVKDRFAAPDATSMNDVKPGEGKIVSVGIGQRLAVYRDPSTNELKTLSPVCPHLGCHVKFNDAEKSWDCPCHGSRYAPDGVVLNGPAAKPLERHDAGDDETVAALAPETPVRSAPLVPD
jgi:Rieske Fe-S protein